MVDWLSLRKRTYGGLVDKTKSLKDHSTRSTSTGDYSTDFSTRIAWRLLDENQLAPKVTLQVSHRRVTLNSHVISIHQVFFQITHIIPLYRWVETNLILELFGKLKGHLGNDFGKQRDNEEAKET